MAMELSNTQSRDKQAVQVKRFGGNGLRKMILASWREYRRNQHLLSSSYHSYAMARRIPKRVWGRHSALFTSMDEYTDDY